MTPLSDDRTHSRRESRIDRRALVARHDVRSNRADPMEPLSVGNGEFAFTVDVTGVQSLRSFHAAGMPLHTQAQWAWHSEPNPEGYRSDDSRELYRAADGRSVPYQTTGDPSAPVRHERAADWLRRNPHRIDLGNIAFRRAGGAVLDASAVADVRQHLSLWHGAIESAFRVDGRAVGVTTACHPDLDLIAVRAESSAFVAGVLELAIEFPYATGDWSATADWSSEDLHRTEVVSAPTQGGGRADLRRVQDDDTYHVALSMPSGWTLRREGRHRLVLTGEGTLELLVAFAPGPLPAELPTVESTLAASARAWSQFWQDGGAVELADSDDPRAEELERRVVLSQYLTRVHCAGSLPPAETGLVTNSWRGKFHLEMHWWHAAHFPLWGRAPLLGRSLHWYERIMPVACSVARDQGYAGARWPKQVGPEGRESPSDVGAFLVWQQPHPIYYAELLRRADGASHEWTMERLAPLVFETAAFMASYPVSEGDRYHLGPPLASAQEMAFRERTHARNPTFELAYWAWGLRTAQRWRRMLGLSPVPGWDRVADRLAPLPVADGRYAELEQPATPPEGHPSMLGALGFVPDVGVVDRPTMQRTLDVVLDAWELDETWGWDHPLAAMTATRLGDPGRAVDALLRPAPSNRFLANGHNVQRSPRLPLYLPGNGGVLFAVAMMAAGFEAAPVASPGFPEGWRVAYEGLTPAP